MALGIVAHHSYYWRTKPVILLSYKAKNTYSDCWQSTQDELFDVNYADDTASLVNCMDRILQLTEHYFSELTERNEK